MLDSVSLIFLCFIWNQTSIPPEKSPFSKRVRTTATKIRRQLSKRHLNESHTPLRRLIWWKASKGIAYEQTKRVDGKDTITIGNLQLLRSIADCCPPSLQPPHGLCCHRPLLPFITSHRFVVTVPTVPLVLVQLQQGKLAKC